MKTKTRKTNPVAKNMEKFNRPATFVDRKKAASRGYSKHKGALYSNES